MKTNVMHNLKRVTLLCLLGFSPFLFSKINEKKNKAIKIKDP
jgi:hypothetical protein